MRGGTRRSDVEGKRHGSSYKWSINSWSYFLDAAITRPGRLDKLLYVTTPDKAAREEIFKIPVKKMQLEQDVAVKEIKKWYK